MHAASANGCLVGWAFRAMRTRDPNWQGQRKNSPVRVARGCSARTSCVESVRRQALIAVRRREAADAGKGREASIVRYRERSNPTGAALEHEQELITAAQVQIERRRAYTRATAHAARHQQLHGTVSNAVTGDGAASGVRRK